VCVTVLLLDSSYLLQLIKGFAQFFYRQHVSYTRNRIPLASAVTR
jgi:hypothetical protein